MDTSLQPPRWGTQVEVHWRGQQQQQRTAGWMAHATAAEPLAAHLRRGLVAAVGGAELVAGAAGRGAADKVALVVQLVVLLELQAVLLQVARHVLPRQPLHVHQLRSTTPIPIAFLFQ